MTRIAAPVINASSMADIAFLLLIFFLVTSTLEEEIGIKSILPPADTQKPSPHSSTLNMEIILNAHGNLFIENSNSSWTEIRNHITEFYKSGTARTQLITTSMCLNQMAKPDLNENEKMRWIWRLEACELNGGSFWEMKEKSQILVECSPAVSYETYIALQDSIHKAVKDLRRKWCRENGIKAYDRLDVSDINNRKVIRTLRLMYPIRIQDVEFRPE
jgi:biopolymer transport protein ExbD